VVTIIYYLGYVGRGEGRDAERGNVGYMLGCTSGRLDQLMKTASGPGRSVSLPATLLCGLLDHDADLPAAAAAS